MNETEYEKKAKKIYYLYLDYLDYLISWASVRSGVIKMNSVKEMNTYSPPTWESYLKEFYTEKSIYPECEEDEESQYAHL